MLLDSNILIYAIRPEFASLRDLVAAPESRISAVSYVEVLGYHRLSAEDRASFADIFDALGWLPLDQPVLDAAVRLRQRRRMSLGDALVAGTALVHDLALVTRNTADFAGIEGLQVVDPLAP